jgi:hypothetical protein
VIVGAQSWRDRPLCSLSAGNCAEPWLGAGFWFGVFLIVLAAWGLHRGTRPGGVYRWMFPRGHAKAYDGFAVVNMVLLVAGLMLVLSPFVRW